MSLFYSVMMDDRVSMLTDGATFSPKGLLIDVASKVVTNQSPPYALTGRGNSAWIEVICKGVRIGSEACKTFEDVIVLFDSVLKQLRKKMDPWPNEAHFELLLAGWGKSGPMQLFVSSFPPQLPEGGPDQQPFTLYHAGWEIGGGPQVSHEELLATGVTMDEILAAGRDVLETFGAAFVELARNKKGATMSHPHLPEIHGVGGFVELTTVRADGVETKILKEWDDEIGSPIDPFARKSRKAEVQ
jgi:hypothetical protein